MSIRARVVLFGMVLTAVAGAVSPVLAATVGGIVSDATGAALTDARVVLRGVATGQEQTVQTGPDGRFELRADTRGTYLLVVTRQGFSESARTIVIMSDSDALMVPMQLELGGLKIGRAHV